MTKKVTETEKVFSWAEFYSLGKMRLYPAKITETDAKLIMGWHDSLGKDKFGKMVDLLVETQTKIANINRGG